MGGARGSGRLGGQDYERPRALQRWAFFLFLCAFIGSVCGTLDVAKAEALAHRVGLDPYPWYLRVLNGCSVREAAPARPGPGVQAPGTRLSAAEPPLTGHGCIKGACPPHCCYKNEDGTGSDCCCVSYDKHECKCAPLPPPSVLEDNGG